MHQALKKDDYGILFQKDKNKEAYSGKERRGGTRVDLPQEQEKFLNALDERMSSRCRDNCIIPKEARSHVGHAVGVIKEMGKGEVQDEIEDGLNSWSDQSKRVKAFFKWYDDGVSTTFRVIIYAVVGAVIALLGVGFWQKLQGG